MQTNSDLNGHLSYYERLPVGHPEKSYGFLLTSVRKYLEAKRRCKALDDLSKGGGRAFARFRCKRCEIQGWLLTLGEHRTSASVATIARSPMTKRKGLPAQREG